MNKITKLIARKFLDFNDNKSRAIKINGIDFVNKSMIYFDKSDDGTKDLILKKKRDIIRLLKLMIKSDPFLKDRKVMSFKNVISIDWDEGEDLVIVLIRLKRTKTEIIDISSYGDVRLDLNNLDSPSKIHTSFSLEENSKASSILNKIIKKWE